MGRKAKFRMFRVDQEICDRLDERKKAEYVRGPLTSYIESVLDRFSRGLLADAPHEEGGDVHGVRVRKLGSDEQRKTA